MVNFFRKQALRRRIRRELDQSERSGLIYEYVRICITEATGKRGPSVGEFEIITAMMMGNVIGRRINRKDSRMALARIQKLARVLLSEEKKADIEELKQ